MKILNFKTSVILGIAFLFSSIVYGQDYAFKVLGAKGDNQLDGSSIKIGSSVQSDQTLTVGQGAYLGLAHKSGKTLEIKKAGEYKVKDLEAKISAGSDGIEGKVFAFIIEELTSDDSKNNRFNQAAKTGSVTRGVVGDIILMLPGRNIEYLPNKVMLKWYLANEDKEESVKEFVVTATNLRGQEIFTKEASSTSLELDLSELTEMDRKLIKYTITAKEDKSISSKEYAFKLPKSAQTKKINEELEKLPQEDTPINQFLLAEFYAKNGLLANAMYSYEKAGEAFEGSYKEFLEFYELTKEARASDDSGNAGGE